MTTPPNTPHSAECCGPPGGPQPLPTTCSGRRPPSANRRGASVHARAVGGLQAVCPRRCARLGGRGAFLAARGAGIKATDDDSRATSFPAAGWRAFGTHAADDEYCVRPPGKTEILGTVSDADSRVEERRRADSGKFERRGGGEERRVTLFFPVTGDEYKQTRAAVEGVTPGGEEGSGPAGTPVGGRYVVTTD